MGGSDISFDVVRVRALRPTAVGNRDCLDDRRPQPHTPTVNLQLNGVFEAEKRFGLCVLDDAVTSNQVRLLNPLAHSTCATFLQR